MIEIDGSIGGGQILRTALTLSALTQKPFRIFNIRKEKPNPGLAMQHLTCARAVRSICRGDLKGAELHSLELEYAPGKIVAGKYDFNIGTAGSVVLVAQTIIPILLFSDKKSVIRIKGGTHVSKSPGYDYFENIFIKALNLMGAKTTSKLLSTGYYPKGGGEIELTIEPSKLHPIELFPKEEPKILIRLGSLPLHIGVREKKIFVHNNFERIKMLEEKTLSCGNSILMYSGLCGIDLLGEIGKRAETVAQEVLDSYLGQKDFDVDIHLADQLLPYYSFLGKGSYSTFQFSDHLMTNALVIKKFLNVDIKMEKNIVSVVRA